MRVRFQFPVGPFFAVRQSVVFDHQWLFSSIFSCLFLNSWLKCVHVLDKMKSVCPTEGSLQVLLFPPLSSVSVCVRVWVCCMNVPSLSVSSIPRHRMLSHCMIGHCPPDLKDGVAAFRGPRNLSLPSASSSFLSFFQQFIQRPL